MSHVLSQTRSLLRSVLPRGLRQALRRTWDYSVLTFRRSVIACRTAGARLPAVEKNQPTDSTTTVDRYWGEHTVNSVPFLSAGESLRYLEWRFEEYPLCREFMDLWGKHDGEVLLDYGCGPGNDVTGFLVHTGARQVIGMDVSAKSLELTRRRLALHRIDLDRVRLIQTCDSSPTVPLPDGSVDFVHSSGVLHHTSHPKSLLREFHRVLRPGGRACIMVYNRESIWLHLHTAYVRMILENAYPGRRLEDVFARNTDGPNCPVARCYSGPEFLALAKQVGFQGHFSGGYLSKVELDCLKQFGAQAIADTRLPAEHRDFLRQLSSDACGYPLFEGKHAGIGGIYHLRKAA
jgi:SAM-dependent methyltransferase